MEEKEQHQASPTQAVTEAQHPPTASDNHPKKSRLPLILGICFVFIAVLGVIGWKATTSTKPIAQEKKVYRVGILSGLDFFLPSSESFKKEMTRLGYIEGDNIIYDFQQSNIEAEKEKKSLQKFIDEKVDLVFSYPTEPSLLARQELQKTTIPMLFVGAFTEQGGLIDSISNPGKNITGVRYPGPDVAAKRLEILHELAPKAKRIWIPYLADYPIVAKELAAVTPIAKSLGLELILFPAKGPQDIEKELQTRGKLADTGIDAILLIPEPIAVTGNTFSLIDAFAVAHKIPFGGTYLPNSNSLFGYNPDNTEMGKLAAPVADKILKGTPAGSISVVTPEAYLDLNYKAAQAFGLTVSESLLTRARQIMR